VSEPLLPPDFGRYRPVGVIGSGAIGTVYRAHDPLIGRDVAVKMIRTETLDDETRAEYLARFGVEARAAGRCSHPGIVTIHDAGESEGRPYLVMELVEGETLQAILADPQRRAALDGVRILLDVLDALAYAHARQVLHRDIKPANIIVTPSAQGLYRAKITDFGIARIDYGTMTQIGDMLGTPNYMAPEQVSGAQIDHRADLFSAAAILHAILAGRPPFAGRTMSDTLLRLTDPAPADLAAIESGPHAAFAPVLRRGLAKSPAARFASAGEFAAALRGVEPDERTLVMAPPASGHTAPDHGLARGALDPVLVQAAEAGLARLVGPMARRHVAQAARIAADGGEFLAILAREIPDPAAAAKFLRAHGGGAGASGGTHGAQMTTGQIAAMASARGISTAAQEAARTVLALYVGPIARVLVNRALREAGSLDMLADLLAREVKAADQPAFRRKLLAALAGQ
jgi:tRNA A-37 threonylcarbamoyl transferase component Bud32